MAPKRKKAEEASEGRVEPKKKKAEEASEGRVVPYSGLPPGWRAVEKEYKSGQYAGQIYVRFESAVHRSIGSAKKAIQIYAEENGKDAAQMLAEYGAVKKKEADERKAETKVRQEAAGKVSKEKREACIARFRDKYGTLSGALVCALPGWRGESKLLENCGQYVASYTDPSGKRFMLMKDIEAHFGNLMDKGKEDEIPDIELARSSIKVDENGRPVNVARHENIVEEFMETSAAKKKKEKTRQVVNNDWYREVSHMRVFPATEKVFAKESVPRAEELKTESEEIRILLTQCGFDSETPLVYVLGKVPGMGVTHRRKLEGVSGFYYMDNEKIGGQAHYRQVSLSKKKPGMLLCSGLSIFYSQVRQGWKLSTSIDDAKAGLFMCVEDQKSPTDLTQPWKIYEPRHVS